MKTSIVTIMLMTIVIVILIIMKMIFIYFNNMIIIVILNIWTYLIMMMLMIKMMMMIMMMMTMMALTMTSTHRNNDFIIWRRQTSLQSLSRIIITIIAKLWKVLLLNCCYHLTIINDGNVKKTMMVILTSENSVCVWHLDPNQNMPLFQASDVVGNNWLTH